ASSVNDKTTSGWPNFHPVSLNFGAAGKSDEVPSFAPPSTQPRIVAICCSDNLGSLRNSPWFGSAYQGGISRLTTFSRIDLAHGRTSLYARSDIGAISPGRWQMTHLA